MTSRREFLAGAAAFSLSIQASPQSTGAHASVADMERAHILSEAQSALAKLPSAAPKAYVDTLPEASADIAALTAAFVLTRDNSYAEHAVASLRARYFQLPLSDARTRTDNSVLDLLPLAEIARASSFLVDSPALEQADRTALSQMFEGTLAWLHSAKPALLARDARDRRASAWLLLSSALAGATQDETQLENNRLRFKKPTLRNQIAPDGRFPQEVATDNPLRNSLLNFDLLCGCAQILSTPFEDLWTYELIEGVGLRSAAAYLFPMLADRNKWPFPADATHFRDLPLRRPGLLLAGRAYSRPEYVNLFRALPATPPSADIADSFPLRQPILWTTKIPHSR